MVNLDEFIDAVDLVVIMVKHNEIKGNMDKLAGKVVLDCHNICKQEVIIIFNSKETVGK